MDSENPEHYGRHGSDMVPNLLKKVVRHSRYRELLVYIKASGKYRVYVTRESDAFWKAMEIIVGKLEIVTK